MIDQIPDFSLLGDDGNIYTPEQFAGKKLVLFFYPKDNTSACTIENIDFSRLLPDFTVLGCIVAGVSRDSGRTHCNFKAKQDLHLLLLTDSDWRLADSLELIRDKKMYGKPVRGLQRSTFLFDEEGRLLQSWINIKAPGHAQDVLNYLKSLN